MGLAAALKIQLIQTTRLRDEDVTSRFPMQLSALLQARAEYVMVGRVLVEASREALPTVTRIGGDPLGAASLRGRAVLRAGEAVVTWCTG